VCLWRHLSYLPPDLGDRRCMVRNFTNPEPYATTLLSTGGHPPSHNRKVWRASIFTHDVADTRDGGVAGQDAVTLTRASCAPRMARGDGTTALAGRHEQSLPAQPSNAALLHPGHRCPALNTTALFWRPRPGTGLAHGQAAGRKRTKRCLLTSRTPHEPFHIAGIPDLPGANEEHALAQRRRSPIRRRTDTS
jgi:hypothetical protein